MKDQLISFETAKLAYDKGFTKETYNMYVVPPLFYGEEEGQISFQVGWHKDMRGAIAAPTQTQLQKWLREEYNLHIEIHSPDTEDGKWLIGSIRHIGKIGNLYNDNLEFSNYEEALEIALQEALNLI